MSEYQFVNHNLTNSQLEAAGVYLSGLKEKYSKPLEGEKEKTSEQIKIIDLAQRHLQAKLTSLGIGYIPLPLERIHVLEPDIYEKQTKDTNPACYMLNYQTIFFNSDNPTNLLANYKNILHELGHYAGYKLFWADINPRNKLVRLTGVYRSGYAVTNRGDDDHLHFGHFAEAVNEKTILEIVSDNQAEIMRELPGIADRFYLSGSYLIQRMIVDEITTRVSRVIDIPPELVWQTIQLGQYSPQMDIIRYIERVFGIGSARVLAALPNGLRGMHRSEAEEITLRYFQEEDPQRRHLIAMNILNERERFRYLNRRRHFGV